MKLNLMEIINALAVLIVAAVIAWSKYREKKLTKEAGLLGNPQRCEDHALAIKEINDKLGQHGEKLATLETKVDNLTKDMDYLTKKMNGK